MTIKWICVERVYCPYCGAGYIDEAETRPMVKCPVCQGQGSLAKQATQELEALIRQSDIETLHQLFGSLAPGYWRMTVRGILREHGIEV